MQLSHVEGVKDKVALNMESRIQRTNKENKVQQQANSSTAASSTAEHSQTRGIIRQRTLLQIQTI